MKRRTLLKFTLLALISLAVIAIYFFSGLNFENERLMNYQISRRLPKILAILMTSFAIGTASLVFQSVINNTIVTPCLLGMDSLYTLIHTLVYFFAGLSSLAVTNKIFSFGLDLAIMAGVSTVIYSYLFKKTGHNILYVILIGTVLTSLFASLQSTLVRVMDPNEYESLLTTLTASFENINTSIMFFSFVILVLLLCIFKKDLDLLNVMTLGKNQAINLGINFNRTSRHLLLFVTLYMSVATALVGPLSFLGLIVANLSRQLFQTYRHSILIAGSAIFGMIALFLGQIIVERFLSYNIPVSVFITIGGGIYFLYLLLSQSIRAKK